jgi:formylglycine-generating enzyme required for sulfatase activity
MNPPTKPTDTRVFRGSSWYNGVPSWVRAASRITYEPACRNSNIGFRCALRVRQPRV